MDPSRPHKKYKPSPGPVGEAPSDRALRFTDLTPTGQGNLTKQVSQMGAAKSRAPGLKRKLRTQLASPDTPQKTRDAAKRRLPTHEAMSETWKDKDITHEGATKRRVGLADIAVRREAGQAEAGTKAGEDWYFQHHGKLAGIASETGHSKEQVIAASAVMSPQNNPDMEVQAVRAYAHAHADKDARITLTPEAAEAAVKLKDGMHPDSVKDYIGKSLHPSRFDPRDLALLSSPNVREHVQTTGNVDLPAMAKSGTKENATKAINVLRGNVKPHEAIDPKSSPKVWSYHESIKNSVPGTPEHEEFMTRMDVALRRPNQTRMDLFGLASSKEGILSPSHPTAEDTWQQAISSGQQLKTIQIPGKTGAQAMQSPAKFAVGEAGSANQAGIKTKGVATNISPEAAMHAWQSHATEGAAAVMSARTGGQEIVPAVGMQAVPWVEARRQAGGGKDRPYESRMAKFHAERDPGPGGGYAMPQEMFTPSGNVTAAARPPAQSSLALGGVIGLAAPKPKAPAKSRKQHFEGTAPSLF